jgi:hypothetical protein
LTSVEEELSKYGGTAARLEVIPFIKAGDTLIPGGTKRFIPVGYSRILWLCRIC